MLQHGLDLLANLRLEKFKLSDGEIEKLDGPLEPENLRKINLAPCQDRFILKIASSLQMAHSLSLLSSPLSRSLYRCRSLFDGQQNLLSLSLIRWRTKKVANGEVSTCYGPCYGSEAVPLPRGVTPCGMIFDGHAKKRNSPEFC